MSDRRAAAEDEFALLRFAAVLAAPEVALVEVEGRMGAALQRRRGLPRLLLEDGGGRIELAAVPGASVVHDDVLRVTFAAPAEVTDGARWTLALRDVLVELPSPDVPAGPERHIALARELNEVRHRLRAAEELTSGAEAAVAEARAQGEASVTTRLEAAEDARRDAEARTSELQAAASARDAELRAEGEDAVRAARAEAAERITAVEAERDAARAAVAQAARDERERLEADRVELEERAGRAEARATALVRERDAAQAEASTARSRTREATRELARVRAELEAATRAAGAGQPRAAAAERSRASASPLGPATAAARTGREAQDAEDERLEDAADPTATVAFDALGGEEPEPTRTQPTDARPAGAPADDGVEAEDDEDPDALQADDALDEDDDTYETPAQGLRPRREDTYESPALDPSADASPAEGWRSARADGPSETVRVLGRDRPRASTLPPPPDADVPPPPFLARWGAPIALGVALLILLVILVSALL